MRDVFVHRGAVGRNDTHAHRHRLKEGVSNAFGESRRKENVRAAEPFIVGGTISEPGRRRETPKRVLVGIWFDLRLGPGVRCPMQVELRELATSYEVTDRFPGDLRLSLP